MVVLSVLIRSAKVRFLHPLFSNLFLSTVNTEHIYNNYMKEYTVDFIDPKTNHHLQTSINAEDKTDARDQFFELYPSVEYINKIVLKS
jgi:hypothetical protein